MEFKDFLRIKNTIHEAREEEVENFYGLISTKESKKVKFYFEDKDITLDEVIKEVIGQKKDKDFLSLKAIIEIIKDLDSEGTVSETTMNDRYRVFINLIGKKKDYTLDGNRITYHDQNIPILIFILIELGTSQTLLNKYTTSSRSGITYSDIKVFFKKLRNFLSLYVGDLQHQHHIFNSFVSYFHLDLFMLHERSLEKMNEIYEVIYKYQNIETGMVNRRISMVENFNREMTTFIDECKGAYEKDIQSQSEKESSPRSIKFNFLQSVGH